MIDVATLVTIVGMAVVTYLTRALGFYCCATAPWARN